MVPRVPELPGDERSGRPGRAGHRPEHATTDELCISSFSPEAVKDPVPALPQMVVFVMHQTRLVSVRVPVLPGGPHKLKPRPYLSKASRWRVVDGGGGSQVGE